MTGDITTSHSQKEKMEYEEWAQEWEVPARILSNMDFDWQSKTRNREPTKNPKVIFLRVKSILSHFDTLLRNLPKKFLSKFLFSSIILLLQSSSYVTTKKQANHPRSTEGRKVFPLFKYLTECYMFLLVGDWACLYFVFFSFERTRNGWSGLLEMQ